MAIIASAIFGRSAFTFGRIRIIRFISSEERCPLNMIYKHALENCLSFAGDKSENRGHHDRPWRGWRSGRGRSRTSGALLICEDN